MATYLEQSCKVYGGVSANLPKRLISNPPQPSVKNGPNKTEKNNKTGGQKSQPKVVNFMSGERVLDGSHVEAGLIAGWLQYLIL